MYSKNFLNQENPSAIIEAFRQWLSLQNYEETTVKNGPTRIAAFMQWVRKNKVQQDEARLFFEHLKRRKSKLKDRALSTNYLKSYLRTLRLFRRFLRETSNVDLEINIVFREREISHHEVFTKAEIKSIYNIIDDDLLGMRDRAMMAVYYGCGLRRNEGVHLLVEDILPDKNLLFVRKGKNYKQRYVPLVGQGKEDLLDYIRIARPVLLNGKESLRLFISYRGQELKSSALYERLKSLMRKAEIKKPCGLHSLRHSIATHLLSNGMRLDQIAKMLGHQSLDTTQIYTHILEELKSKKQ
jgi:site-specific recombinase XerD